MKILMKPSFGGFGQFSHEYIVFAMKLVKFGPLEVRMKGDFDMEHSNLTMKRLEQPQMRLV